MKKTVHWSLSQQEAPEPQKLLTEVTVFCFNSSKALEDNNSTKGQRRWYARSAVVLLMNLGAGCTSVIADWKASKPAEFLPEKNCWADSKKIKSQGLLLRHFLFWNWESMSLKKIFPYSRSKKCLQVSSCFSEWLWNIFERFSENRNNTCVRQHRSRPVSEISAEELFHSRNEILKGIPVGRIYKNAEVRIFPLKESSVATTFRASAQFKEGAIGEIVVSGPSLF